MSLQFGYPLNNRCFNNNCRFHWNFFTMSLLTMSSDNLLYIHMKPNALRRSTSRNLWFLISMICFPCLALPLRVGRAWSVDIWKNVLKWSGPFPSAHVRMTPSIAMSRLHRRGAKLKWNSASASDKPISNKNLS